MFLRYLQDKIKTYSTLLPLAGFLLLLSLTWLFFEGAKKDSRELMHAELQNLVQTSIADYVEKNNPYITGITFHKIWTKKTNKDSQIEVFFSYSLEEEGNKQKSSLLIDGKASLDQSKQDDRLWVLNNFQVTGSLLDFSEPMRIKASSKK